MWSSQILGIDVYYILNWFYIYSFLGWVWESAYVSVKSKKLVNRGFITGPLCTIYGCGGVLVYLLARPFSNNIFLLFFVGMAVATVLEYVTAVIMESIFHTSWWNYSEERFNFQGRICAGASIGWGCFTLVLFYVFQPFVEFLVDLYPRTTGQIGIIVVTILYSIDFINSVIAASSLSRKIASLEGIVDEITDYFKKTKLYETSEELRERMEVYKKNLHSDKWKEKIEEYRSRLSELLTEHDLLDKRKEIENHLADLNKKYESLKEKMGFVSKRFMKAYPNLLSISKKNKDDEKNQSKKEEKKE
jgi:uncharacterized membrane protein